MLYDDNVVHPHPPITRVLKETVAKLEAAGHEIVEWEPSMHKECIAIMVYNLFPSFLNINAANTCQIGPILHR